MTFDHTLRCTFMPSNSPWPVGWYWVVLDQKRRPITHYHGPFATMGAAQADAQLETGGAIDPDVKKWKPVILRATKLPTQRETRQ